MVKKIAGTLLSLTATATAVIGLNASPALASGVFQFHNVGSGRCLDSNSGGSVYAQGCNGGNYQRWSLWNNQGSYLFKDTSTGRFLCEEADYGLLDTDSPDCWSGGGEYGNWTLVYVGQANYLIKNVHTGDCIGDLPRYGFGTWSCDAGNPGMQWYKTS